MSRPTVDETLMNVSFAFSRRSTCLRKQIGAVLAVDGRVVATGYSGAPSGQAHCTPDVCGPDKPCTRTIHAEANAVAFAARHGVRTDGATLYTTISPCNDCAKLLINAGVVRVVYWDTYRDERPLELLRLVGIRTERFVS